MKSRSPDPKSLLFASSRRRQALVLFATTAVSILLFHSSLARASSNPRVSPPHAHAYGKSYGEWVATYWQWLFSFPNAQSPAYEQGEVVFGAQNQSGPVWFLESGNFGVWERSVRIPAGKAILFSLGGAEIDTNPATGIQDGSAEDLFGFLDFVFGSGFVITVSGEVDGVPLKNVDRYLVRSPVFDLTVPDDGFAGTAAGDWSAAAQGWFFLLAPLSKGRHTVHVHIEAPDFNVVGDTTYHITVE
jgi:hypothetical protein